MFEVYLVDEQTDVLIKTSDDIFDAISFCDRYAYREKCYHRPILCLTGVNHFTLNYDNYTVFFRVVKK